MISTYDIYLTRNKRFRKVLLRSSCQVRAEMLSVEGEENLYRPSIEGRSKEHEGRTCFPHLICWHVSRVTQLRHFHPPLRKIARHNRKVKSQGEL
jgi:hypothetical protein